MHVTSTGACTYFTEIVARAPIYSTIPVTLVPVTWYRYCRQPTRVCALYDTAYCDGHYFQLLHVTVCIQLCPENVANAKTRAMREEDHTKTREDQKYPLIESSKACFLVGSSTVGVTHCGRSKSLLAGWSLSKKPFVFLPR